jgi:hypothetical protein
VPAGGIWTGVHNSTNGGGPFPTPTDPFVPADFVADGFNFMGVDKAGKLLIEDLVLHPNTTAGVLGVNWEGANGDQNNAPFLYREVPADAKFTATIKIDAQTSGNWSYAPIIARLKGPAGGPDTPVGLNDGDPLDPTESFVTMGSFRVTPANNLVADILTQSIVNTVETEIRTGGAVGNGLPLWVRMVKTGGLFESFTSLDGTTFTPRNSIINGELATPGETLQVGLGFMSGTSDGAAVQGTAEFDFFEIVVEPLPIPRTAYWRPTASLGGSGTWDNANNWNSIEVPGIIPNHDTLKVIFADGDAAPPTGDVRVRGPATVFLNSAVMVKGLEFNHTHKYAIGGSGSIRMAGNAGDTDPTPTINVLAGSHEVDVDFSLDRNTNLTAAPGTRLDFNNQFDFVASNRALNVTGGGKVNFNSTIDFPTSANGVVNVNSTGNVGGSGRINGTLNNNAGGRVSPGVGLGTLAVDVGYIQTGNATLAIELGGTAPGQFDKITAAIVNLGASTATLDVALVNGFVPQPTDTFEIIRASGNLQSGSRFANTPGDVLTTPFGTFSVTYNYAAGSRNVTLSNFMSGSSPGDFNTDGKVDAADYAVWRKTDGSQAGYNAWRANFGRTAGSGSSVADASAVPEPGSIGLLLVVLVTALGMNRHHRP